MKKVIMLMLLALSTTVFAGGDPHHEPTESMVTNITNNTVIEDNSAIAAALGAHQFGYGTYAEQKSVTVSNIEGDFALSGAFAHRDCRTCGLFSTAIAAGKVNGKTNLGIVAGYTWSY